ncbi:MAG: hypothetical protein U5N53_03000 [Mycobacterium sp.]|nr:hypothetical protein [Mycobacterium sp.]
MSEPKATISFADSWEESWFCLPAIVDLDGDGKNEVLAPRGETLKIWNADGTLLRKHLKRLWPNLVERSCGSPS